MKDKIVIDGILYEKVAASRGRWHPEGKFNQIVHYEYPDEVFLGTTDPKARNSKFPFILCVDWMKGRRDQLDRAALSQDGLDNEDIDDIEMSFDLSKNDVSKICRYILDLDLKRTKPWDRASVGKLRKELHRKYGFVSKDEKYGFVSKDEFLNDYCSSEWKGYIQAGYLEDDYWRDIVIGEFDMKGFDDDYTPDKQWDDEWRDYYYMVFGPRY